MGLADFLAESLTGTLTAGARTLALGASAEGKANPGWANRGLTRSLLGRPDTLAKRGRLLQPVPTVNNVSTMVKADGLASIARCGFTRLCAVA
jgi:hypothetical protein